MKKLTFLAVAFAATIFAACGGQKGAQNTTDENTTEKSFEQEQVEASIKMHLDSLAASVGQLKQMPFLKKDAEGFELTDQEKQVKPDYLLDPAVAENATTLSEKYRVLSALTVDKKVAEVYDMPTDDYTKAIAKLAADINDPSFKAIDDASNIFETSQTLYDAMNENGRINYFWQLVATSLVEQLYVVSQNTEKFITAFDDESAANVTFRIVLLTDAVERLAKYDPEFEPVAEAVKPLMVLNAISVDELKSQIAEAKEEIVAARNKLMK